MPTMPELKIPEAATIEVVSVLTSYSGNSEKTLLASMPKRLALRSTITNP